MSHRQRLRRPAVVLGAMACLAGPVWVWPAIAQDAGGAQPQTQQSAPDARGAPTERAGEDAAPQQQQRPQPPSGCPFRNNKLDLIA